MMFRVSTMIHPFTSPRSHIPSSQKRLEYAHRDCNRFTLSCQHSTLFSIDNEHDQTRLTHGSIIIIGRSETHRKHQAWHRYSKTSRRLVFLSPQHHTPCSRLPPSWPFPRRVSLTCNEKTSAPHTISKNRAAKKHAHRWPTRASENAQAIQHQSTLRGFSSQHPIFRTKSVRPLKRVTSTGPW